MVLALLVLLPVVSRIKLTEVCVIGLFGSVVGVVVINALSFTYLYGICGIHHFSIRLKLSLADTPFTYVHNVPY